MEKKPSSAWPITPEKTSFKTDYDTSTIEIDKVNNLLDMSLIDLKMTALSRWILLNNGIDTMRELSRLSADEIKAFPDMTEEVYKELEGMLRQMEMDFRPENRDPFLYGYPDHIRKIIDEKKAYWQYVFYYEVLAQNFAWLESFSRFRYREDYPHIPKGHDKIDDRKKMIHFLVEQLEFLKNLMQETKDIFNDEERAFGKKGAVPDPVMIAVVAEKMIGKYKSLINWMIDMKRYDMDPVYKEGLREFILLGEDLAETFETLREQSNIFPEKVYQFHRGEITEDDIPTDMTLTMNIKDDHYKTIHDMICKDYHSKNDLEVFLKVLEGE